MTERLRDPSFNPACPSCVADRRHSESDTKEFHPYAGHGFTKEQRWSHPELKKEAESRG